MLIIENGEFVDCNSATVAMLGYESKEDIIHTPPFKLSPEFQPDGVKSFDKAADMIRLAQEHGSHQFEWNHLKKDGTIIPVEVSLTALQSVDGSQFHTVWRDLTGRNKIEQALRDSEERFRQIFEANPDPVILAKIDGGAIVGVNRAFELLSGISRNEALGHNAGELGLWANDDSRRPFLEQLYKDGEVNNLEAEFRVTGGLVRTGLLSARLVDVNSEQCMLIVIRDINAEKEAERALKEMDRMKNEFISTAAHELRTPLTTIMGFAEFLIDPNDFGGFTTEQRKDFLNEIYTKAESLNRIIDDLLDVSRIENGNPVTLRLETKDMRKVLTRVFSLYSMQYPDHRFSLDLQKIPEEMPMNIDEHRIVQVLDNLLSNSVKYTPKGREILMRSKVGEHGCEVLIVDKGIGMAPDQLERIFDKFYRADSSNTAVGGLGLGMSIVRQIVEAHQGTINVISQSGRGTTVTFYLPFDCSQS